MANHRKQIALGAFLPGGGVHGAGWRLPEVDVLQSSSFDAFRRVAQRLEEGCFDTLFMNDSVGVNDVEPSALERNTQVLRWDPLTLLPALAVVTERIGLTATANTTYNEPYNLARRLSSLDQLSAGRAGWNCVTSLSGGENFNRDDHVLHADRYARAEEFVDVVTGLWDSWDDDAAIRDKESGRWVDPGKMHLLNHRGTHFTVRGPLNAPRAVQGYPVIAQAGASDPGRDLAARTGELIFTAAQTIDEGVAFVADITARAARHGRTPDDFRIMPGVSVVTAETEAEALAKYDRLYDITDSGPRLRAMSKFAGLGVDLSAYPLDGPVPLPEVIPETNTHKSRQKLVVDLIRRENPTIRQLFRKLTAGGHRVLVGTPHMVADDFEAWFHAGAACGFNIMFPELLGSVDDFVRLVVPELQRRGLFRTAYTGTTLREHLGLRRPANRYAIAPSPALESVAP
jgi:FMN-dependent oxidoreductase (nitrilotriacetate monooxygenase family)